MRAPAWQPLLRGPWQRLRTIAGSEMLQLNLLAVIVGAAVALLTWLFMATIDAVRWFFYTAGGYFAQGNYIDNELGFYALLVPAAGGLLAGLMIRYGKRGARGHGVPVVMEAMAVNQARLGTRLALTKGFAAATCIGAGFSLGRVGPVVLMASTLGSEVGQRCRLSVEQTRVMLGCGAAAAITTAFNAPLGGVIFAIELILTQFRTRSFIPLVVASVMATTVARALKGDDLAAFSELPAYSLASPLEYPLYIALGLLAGLAAVGFIRLLYGVDTLAERFAAVPLPVQTALGGLAVGGIALSFPEVLGNGFDISANILNNEYTALMLVSLLLLKLVATSISIGSGGSGGVFTPSLFLGAALGGAFGHLVGGLGFTAAPGAYALVGMAAFLAATTRATLTAIILLFELSGDYQIILPLMLACVVADGVCYVLSEHTIYTAKLARRGIALDLGADQDLMRMVRVGEAMTRRVMTLTPDTPLELAITLTEETGHMSFPVVDGGKLVGLITWTDLHRAVERGDRHRLVSDYLATDLVTVTPGETLATALDRLGSREIGHLPVVDPRDPRRLVGFITKGDLIRAYNRRRLAEHRPALDK